MDQKHIENALKLIFEGIRILQSNCSHGREYTIDGRLVGDIGEIIAAREFELNLDRKSRKAYDAKTFDERDVQIKATFKDSLTFTSVPQLYLGMKLYPDGRHEVVYNGPGNLIAAAFRHRKGIGEKQLSFPIAKLRDLSANLPSEERVPKRSK